MFLKNIVNKLVNKPLKYKLDLGNLYHCVIIAKTNLVKFQINRIDHSKDLPTGLVYCYFPMKSHI